MRLSKPNFGKTNTTVYSTNTVLYDRNIIQKSEDSERYEVQWFFEYIKFLITNLVSMMEFFFKNIFETNFNIIHIRICTFISILRINYQPQVFRELSNIAETYRDLWFHVHFRDIYWHISMVNINVFEYIFTLKFQFCDLYNL